MSNTSPLNTLPKEKAHPAPAESNASSSSERRPAAAMVRDLSGPSSGIALRTTGPLAFSKLQSAPNPSKARVLIIDDEPRLCTLLTRALSSAYDCDVCGDGETALQKFETESYDVVLCDLTLRPISGLEVLARLQRRTPTTPVILMSGMQDLQQIMQAMRMGAFDYVLKPFSIEDIELDIERALRHREILEETTDYQIKLESLVVERTSALQRRIEDLSAQNLELSVSFRATLYVLTAVLETRDVDAPGHTERVVTYALLLGQQMGLSQRDLTTLENGALLRDLGTIKVSEEILRKKGALTDEERATVQLHPILGGSLVRRIGMFADAAPIVEQHHERWDGEGYPYKLKGKQIHPGARIVAVADCIEAMTSGRPYKAPQPIEAVAEELRRCAGTHFDPAVVEGFFQIPLDEWDRIVSHSIRNNKRSFTGPLVPIAT